MAKRKEQPAETYKQFRSRTARERYYMRWHLIWHIACSPLGPRILDPEEEKRNAER